MKYVMLKVKASETLEYLLPIIFPKGLVHADVAKAISGINGIGEVTVESAGEITIAEPKCFGQSDTLNVKAHADDALIIAIHDYTHGMI